MSSIFFHWSASFGGTSEGQLDHNAAHRLSQCEGFFKCSLPFPLFGGHTTTILHGLTYPKILCAPLLCSKEKKKMITVRSSGADLIMIIMITLLWVQITGLPLHGALLTGNTPAIDRAISPLLLESAGLKTTWTRPAKVSLKELPSKAAKAAAPGLGHSYCFFSSPLCTPVSHQLIAPCIFLSLLFGLSDLFLCLVLDIFLFWDYSRFVRSPLSLVFCIIVLWPISFHQSSLSAFSLHASVNFIISLLLLNYWVVPNLKIFSQGVRTDILPRAMAISGVESY